MSCRSQWSDRLHLPARLPLPAMQTDPSLPERNASLLEEFESAPWLLPPRTPALPYAGVHDLEELLALRGTPMGRYNRTIALLTFNQQFSRMTCNTSEFFNGFLPGTGKVRRHMAGMLCHSRPFLPLSGVPAQPWYQ